MVFLSKCFRILFILVFCSSLFGCAIRKISSQDGAPCNPPSRQVLDKIQDAVPKAEPLSRYGNRFGKNARSNSYVALNRRYVVMNSSRGYRAQGLASWYGTKFQGRKTSSGEAYNMYAMTAAHPTLPLPTYAKVTNLENGKSVVVKINDRGPFHKKRLIDLSYVAAYKLGILGRGTGKVEVQSIDPRDHGGKLRDSFKVAPRPNPLARHTKVATQEKLYLQLGAFQKRINAEALLNKVGRISKLPIQITVAKNKESSVFKVWMGPFNNARETQKLSEELTKAQLPNPVVVTKLP